MWRQTKGKKIILYEGMQKLRIYVSRVLTNPKGFGSDVVKTQNDAKDDLILSIFMPIDSCGRA